MTYNDIINLLCTHVGWISPITDRADRVSLDYLIEGGFLLIDDSNRRRTTEKGRAYIQGLGATPLPVRTWVVQPRIHSCGFDRQMLADDDVVGEGAAPEKGLKAA